MVGQLVVGHARAQEGLRGRGSTIPSVAGKLEIDASRLKSILWLPGTPYKGPFFDIQVDQVWPILHQEAHYCGSPRSLARD